MNAFGREYGRPLTAAWGITYWGVAVPARSIRPRSLSPAGVWAASPRATRAFFPERWRDCRSQKYLSNGCNWGYSGR